MRISATIGDLLWVFSCACCRCNFFSFVQSFELVPSVRYLVVGIDGAAQVIQQEAIGLPMLGIATSATHRCANYAKSIKLAQCFRHSPSFDSIFDKLLRGNDQVAVAMSTVLTKFKLDPRLRQQCVTRKHAKCRAVY